MTKLEILKACIDRLDYFGAPDDSSPIFVMLGNTCYELVAEEGPGSEKQFDLGDLREAVGAGLYAEGLANANS
jgi:hypothetical protein